MAQLAIAAVGALALGPVGLGLTTAGTGFMLGSLAYTLMAPGQKSYGPRLNDLKVTGTEYGAAIPWIAGSPRVAGQIIWASDRRETANEEDQGKGGGPTYTSYTYDVDLLILLSENEIAGVSRIWSNGELVYGGGVAQEGIWVDMRAYTGADDQLPDPTYEAAVGLGNAPAYRGMGTVLIQGLQLGNGGSIPNLTFELAAGRDMRESMLVCVTAARTDTDALRIFDPAATQLPTWQSYISEFVGSGAVQFNAYTSLSAPGRVDVAGPVTLPIDVDSRYLLVAFNAFWNNDACAFNLEFLDTVGNVVAVVSSPGYVADKQLSHYLYYGASSGTLTAAKTLFPYHNTHGIITFEAGALRFVRDANLGALSGNDSFTFACNARSIRSVRVSGIHVVSTYSGAEHDPSAYVHLQRLAPDNEDSAIYFLPNIIGRLMGRCGYATSDYVVDDMALRAPVYALTVGQVSSTRSVLEVLQQAYFVEASAADRVHFRARATAPVVTIAFADLGMSEGSAGDDEPLALRLGNDLELPAQLALSYANMAGDYQTATEQSDRLLSGQQSTEAVQLPLGLYPAQAKGIVDGLLMDKVASLCTTTIKLPLKYARLEAGDVINAVNSDGRTYRLRIQSKTDAMPALELQCVLDDVGAIESASITDTGYVETGTVIQPARTRFEALDIPILRDADDAAGYYVAVAPQRAAETDKWPGAVVAQSWDSVSYAQLLTTTAQCVMGTATTLLGKWLGGPVFDESNTVTVQVSGELASSTRDAMLLDESINALLLGNEVLRFRTATLLSPGTYLLSGLLRGQRGTEWAIDSHAVGECCVLLGNSLRRIASQTNEIGLQRQIKAVTMGMFLSDGAPKDFADMGVGLKPYAPANPRALADGPDLLVTWQRRTRRSYQYAGAAPVVPLGEATEAYRVRVYTGTALRRSDVVTTASYRYTSDMRAADGMASGTAVQFEICQISATAGPGYPSNVGATTP